MYFHVGVISFLTVKHQLCFMISRMMLSHCLCYDITIELMTSQYRYTKLTKYNVQHLRVQCPINLTNLEMIILQEWELRFFFFFGETASYYSCITFYSFQKFLMTMLSLSILSLGLILTLSVLGKITNDEHYKKRGKSTFIRGGMLGKTISRISTYMDKIHHS